MIDILFYLTLLLAFIQGWRKGLIVGIFSLICGLVGLAAAIKLSAIVASHLKTASHIKSPWLPVVAFILVFITVIIIIRLASKLLESILKMAMLGWLNKLGGILFFLLLYVSFYSILLFYGTQSKIISMESTEHSHVYQVIAPFGPAVIRVVASVIPFGQDMFIELEGFFAKVAQGIR